MNPAAAAILACAAGSLIGCAVTPSTIVQRPASAPAYAAAPVVAANGAIYQSGGYRPMFEDRRARHVGDILIIAVNEKTTAAKSGANSASKSGSASAAVPSLFGVPGATVARLGMQASSDVGFEEEDAARASNSFSGTVGVTVTEVLPNGNLVVSGEKQIAFDKGAEFVRFSGVVNPDTIVRGNTVSSTQVADVRVEYRSNSRIDKAEMMSLMARFFLSLVPL
jgi:flagellar L-ring protein precursor FlgH